MIPKRILIALGPSAGGVGTHVRQLYAGLTERGHDVRVAGPSALGERILASLGDAFCPVELPGAWKTSRTALRELTGLCGDADLLHVHGLRAGMVGVFAARRARIPSVVELHNLVTRETGGSTWRATRAAEPLIGRLATESIGISPEISAQLGSRARTILLAVEAPGAPRGRGETRALLGAADDDVLAICVARFQPQKSLHTLVEAACHLDPGIRVLLVGDGSLRQEIEDQIASTGARVELLGLRDDVGDLLVAADIAVLSSAWEGVPFFVHEAAWCGLPLVATDVGGTPIVVRDGETGVLVPPSRPDMIAQALNMLAGDPELRARLGATAHDVEVAEFSMSAMLTAIESVYEEALRR